MAPLWFLAAALSNKSSARAGAGEPPRPFSIIQIH
jgi:hypothetical protein